MILNPKKQADRISSVHVNRYHELRETFVHLKENKSAMIGLAIILFLVFVAIFAPWIAPNNPFQRNLAMRLKPGIWAEGFGTRFLLGTDYMGRGIFSRIVFGARDSLSVGFIAVAIATSLGTILGLAAGYYGRLVDHIVSRFVDIMFAFPSILLAIAIMAALGPGLEKAMIAIGIVYTPQIARVVRGSVLQVKGMAYIDAERAIGSSNMRIIFAHILPNIVAPLIVYMTLSVASAVLDAAALGFLGLGAQPPRPEWGAMLANSRQYLLSGAWWAITFPGLAIMSTVLSLNLFGDGLRDALDPKLRK